MSEQEPPPRRPRSYYPFAHLLQGLGAGLRDPGVRGLLAILLALLLVGTGFYVVVEHWTPLDAFYFCVITLATVGYGDLVPTTPTSRAFTIVYVMVGIGLFVSFVSALAAAVVQRSQAPDDEGGGRGQ